MRRYIHLEDGGDRPVARTAAGLNVSTEDFGVLPPRFSKGVGMLSNDEWISIVPNYTKYSREFQQVIVYLVASVVYRVKLGWIEQNLPKDSKLFSSRFWTNTTILQYYKH